MFEKKILKGDGRTTMTDLRLNFKLIAAFCSRELNQMTNVPVNTHLIFGPTVKPVLGDHRWEGPNVVSQGRWSLRPGNQNNCKYL